MEVYSANGADMPLDELNAAIHAKFTGPMDAIEFPPLWLAPGALNLGSIVGNPLNFLGNLLKWAIRLAINYQETAAVTVTFRLDVWSGAVVTRSGLKGALQQVRPRLSSGMKIAADRA